jgi:serine/threonine protein kinase
MASTVVPGEETESHMSNGENNLAISFIREKLENAGVFENIQDRWHSAAALHGEPDGYATFQDVLAGLVTPDVPKRIGDMQDFERYILRELVAGRLRGFGDLGMEIRELGKGAFGRVFLHLFTRAHSDLLYPIDQGTLCAVKELHRSDHYERFHQEIQLMQKLSETGITPSFLGSGVAEVHHERRSWFAMEYVRGRDLRCLLQARPGEGVPPSLVADILVILLRYIRELSKNGIVHRDLKPENVLLEDSGRLRLLDLGLAVAPKSERTRITAEGLAAGTPAYAAPELFLGKFRDATTAADLYSAGAIGYHLLTGRSPCAGMNNAQIVAYHGRQGFPEFDCIPKSCPQEMEAVLRRLLAHDPTARLDSEEAMLRLLEGGGSSLQPSSGDLSEFPDSHPGALKIKVPPEHKGELFPTPKNDLTLVAAITDSYASLSSRSGVPPAQVTPPRSGVRTALYSTVALGGIAAAGTAWYAWQQSIHRGPVPPIQPTSPSQDPVPGPSERGPATAEGEKNPKRSFRFEKGEQGCVLTLEGGRDVHFASEDLLPFYAGKDVVGAGFMSSDVQVRALLGIDSDAELPKEFEGISPRMGWVFEHGGKTLVFLGSSAVMLQQDSELALYRDPALVRKYPAFAAKAAKAAKRTGNYKSWTQDPCAGALLQELKPTSAKDPWVTTVGTMPHSWTIKSKPAWLSTVNGSIGLWQQQIKERRRNAEQ